MTVRVRSDLRGQIVVSGHTLRAGDEVPAGVRVHKAWTVPVAGAPEPSAESTEVPKPHANAGAAKWSTYAEQIGLALPADLSKAEIRQAVEEAEQDADND